MYEAPYNFRQPIDDYGNLLTSYTSSSFQSWTISTSVYGGFSRCGFDDFALVI
jgi:hypothetical protein